MTGVVETCRTGFSPSRPSVSIVVVIFNMEREGKRTLYSLSTAYQSRVASQDYEVIVVDNGSLPAFPADYVKTLPGQFRCFYVGDASPSPAAALNFGLGQSRGTYVGMMIDGARIVTPGLIGYAIRAFRAFEPAVVTPLSWHLGPDLQRRAMASGYDKAAEDALLAGIDWPRDGYRLFEIASIAASSKDGWFKPQAESTCLFAARSDYERIGGYDEQFDAPGGGLVNHDAYRRLCSLTDTELVILLGEGTFHQLHGGVSTNTSEEAFAARYRAWGKQYQALRGEAYTLPQNRARFLGHVPPSTRRFLHFSSQCALADEFGGRRRWKALARRVAPEWMRDAWARHRAATHERRSE
jgi:hypothetical protein